MPTIHVSEELKNYLNQESGDKSVDEYLRQVLGLPAKKFSSGGSPIYPFAYLVVGQEKFFKWNEFDSMGCIEGANRAIDRLVSRRGYKFERQNETFGFRLKRVK